MPSVVLSVAVRDLPEVARIGAVKGRGLVGAVRPNMKRLILILGCVVAGCATTSRSGDNVGGELDTTQLVFESPEAAVEDLIAAAEGDDSAAFLKIFGNEGRELARSGDPVADRHARERFVDAVKASVVVEKQSFPGKDGAPVDVAFLSIGEEGISFPIALVREAAGWRFDTAVGKEEILNRRVGENELRALEILEALHLAQQEYSGTGHDGGKPGRFAERFISAPGKHDGLFWQGEPQSPLGPLFGEVEAVGYHPDEKNPEPVFGYSFRILSRQGKSAPGGARTFLRPGGHLEGGYAFVAFPAKWGNSGVMTFMQGSDGVVYQKNLGPNTSSEVATVEAFDPDPSWEKVIVP